MTLRAPIMLSTSIVTDDEFTGARLSSALGKRGHYLPLFDGPRPTREDAVEGVLRRSNALSRVNAKRVILTGLSDQQDAELANQLPRYIVRCAADDVEALADTPRLAKERLSWGRHNIGAGLLKALYAGQLIARCDNAPTNTATSGKTGHLVVCEAGEPLSEVIAANYAHALGAGLAIIPPVDDVDVDHLMEGYYSSENAYERSQLQAKLRALCGDLAIPAEGSLTFISRKLPFGVGFPELPSTHLPTYPDCGIPVANGFAAEQRGTLGVNVAVLVDLEKTDVPEIAAAAKLLPRRSVFVRGYSGAVANVRNITDMVEYFPYDLLLFATHCSDAPGWRWTYKFTDSEGINRTVIVDVAIGVGPTDDPDILEVTQFNYFHSLDGVPWNDPVAKAGHYIRTAMNDWSQRTRENKLEPASKEPLDQVRSSAAMAMHDNNYLPMPVNLADWGSPFIINNACVRLHELAGRYTFGKARTYVGTLYPVLPFEAESIAVQLLDKHWGKWLPHAL
ncbi:MAG: hypothetical protein K5821_06985 [Nitrobacter sp.]|uniref:hypothetical protein n=1 Tax=Nitrobacter sp. TaxID=29420 RepID=UPI002605510D|nr:hypothetical protein [Nitrobacter sp.]MCV0386163.1 hypothetical protein [Nitrobacter sp.]